MSSQISVWLLPETKKAFGKYAEEVGVDDSELAKLLILRESKLKRLATLKREGNIPVRKRQLRGTAEQLEKITAHLSSASQVQQFDAYAGSCGLVRSTAGALLLEIELSEKWLEKALSSSYLQTARAALDVCLKGPSGAAWDFDSSI